MKRLGVFLMIVGLCSCAAPIIHHHYRHELKEQGNWFGEWCRDNPDSHRCFWNV